MTEERKKVIKSEAERRLNRWLINSSIEGMSKGTGLNEFNYMTFNIALALNGRCLVEKEDWIEESDQEKILNDGEFFSEEYDEIVYPLYEHLLNNVLGLYQMTPEFIDKWTNNGKLNKEQIKILGIKDKKTFGNWRQIYTGINITESMKDRFIKSYK